MFNLTFMKKLKFINTCLLKPSELKQGKIRLKPYLFILPTLILTIGTSCTKKPTPTPSIIDVSSILIDQTSTTLQLGETIKLTATIYPEDATDRTITWSSSNPEIASVANGTVTAINLGTAIITAKAGDVSAKCEVTVIPIGVSSIVLNMTSATLSIGEKTVLTATIYPEDATDQTITWSSSNPDVASVFKGTITAVNLGTATITAKAGEVSAECEVTVVPVDVSSIVLNVTSATLSIGEQTELTATIYPEDATDKTITWSSSDPNVASVLEGTVTAINIGSATITAQSGEAKAECLITVIPVEVTSITLNKTSVTLSVGETFELIATIYPGNATDKTITWSSSDTNIASVTNGVVTAIAPGSAEITAIASNGISSSCNISAIIKPDAGGSEGTGDIEW